MKIHHVTMPATDPAHVASVLAELVGGRALPMPHPEGAHMVYAGDEDGTLLEVWPSGARAAVGQHDVVDDGSPLPMSWPHHGLLSVPTDEAEILTVFERDGWPAEKVHQGPPGRGFTLIRGWLERQQVIEFATPEMTAEYAAFVQAYASRF